MSRYWAGPWSSERNNRGWSNHLVREARGIPIVFALYLQKTLKSWTHYLKCFCLSFRIVKVGISESTSRIIIRFKWSKPGMYPKKCLVLVSLSHVWLFATPWTIARQTPLSMEFSRQEYWSGLPFTSPRESSWPRDQIQVSALQADSLQSELQGSPMYHTNIRFSILMQIRERYSPLADAASKVHGLTSTQCFIGRKSLCFLQVGTAYSKDIKPNTGLARRPLYNVQPAHNILWHWLESD